MNIIPDSFHSLLAPDLQRYIALKQLLGRCFDTSSKVFFELDRFLWGLGKPPADLTPETFQKCVALWSAFVQTPDWLECAPSGTSASIVGGRFQIALSLIRRSSRKLARSCSLTSSRMTMWQSYWAIATICRDHPCAEQAPGWRLSYSTPQVFAGVNCSG